MYQATGYVGRLVQATRAMEDIITALGPDAAVLSIYVTPSGVAVHVDPDVPEALGLTPHATERWGENYHHSALWRGVELRWLVPA